MEPFFPFIHQIPKKEIIEQLPLYIELEPPTSEDINQSIEEEEETKIIIIDLW